MNKHDLIKNLHSLIKAVEKSDKIEDASISISNRIDSTCDTERGYRSVLSNGWRTVDISITYK